MILASKKIHHSQYKKSFKPKINQKAWNQIQCEGMVKHALDDMQSSGFDFVYTTKQEFQKDSKIKQMLRTVYLRFNCGKCKDQKNKNKQRRWTSICGTVGIQFQLEKIKQKRRFPYLIIFKLQIYRMKCLKCGKYGEAEVYDSQLQNVQRQFCKIIANILNKVPPKKPRRNSEKDVPLLENHLCQLCQACKLQKCACNKCKTR